MTSFFRREFVIILFDLFISLFAFWLACYFGDLPRWYWLVFSAVIWVILGGVSRKLQFGSYKRLRYALLGIFSLDILSGMFLYLLYRYCVLGYEYDYSILLATGIIIVLEWGLYVSIRRLVYRKIPYFYEEPPLSGVTENGINTTIRPTDEIRSEDVDKLLRIILEKDNCKEVLNWIVGNSEHFSEQAILLDSPDPESVLAHKTRTPKLIVHLHSLNKVRHLNSFFSYSNYCLEEGGCIACHCTTSGIRKERIMRQMPVVISHLFFFLDYCWHRVISKLSFTKGFYYWVTQGKMRVLTRVEVLGRFYRAGFDIVHEEVRQGEFYVIATKVKDPIRNDKPSSSLLIRLRRKGKDGRDIGVYKFRTMYSYSEYLQPYIYKQEGLCNGGKIANDYRINTLGKFLRSVWLDELPMLINWLKGDLKLVGVRPLSTHYFSLYSKELQQLRTKVKPGLLPPYYADMPTTLEEIQESEKRYLQAYMKKPFKTDWVYFWRAVLNIVFRGKRSK